MRMASVLVGCSMCHVISDVSCRRISDAEASSHTLQHLRGVSCLVDGKDIKHLCNLISYTEVQLQQYCSIGICYLGSAVQQHMANRSLPEYRHGGNFIVSAMLSCCHEQLPGVYPVAGKLGTACLAYSWHTFQNRTLLVRPHQSAIPPWRQTMVSYTN